jgi:hypothetical protein
MTMKAVLALSVALAAIAPTQAEIFRPGAGRGAPREGHSDRGQVRVAPPRGYHGDYVYRHRPTVHVSYGPRYYPSYGYYPAYGYYPGYGVDYPYYGSSGYYGSGSAASTGFWLGALAGGIIGNNSGDFRHNGWRGAAWGAGAGWLLGSVVDANRRYDSYPTAPVTVTAPVQATAAPAQAAPAAAAPQQVTIINNYYNSPSPMSGANSLFGR